MIFFTADTHFGDERTLKQAKRPFKTVEYMNDYIIDRWNNDVSDNDIVYHLGDFGDHNFAHRLRGNIILLLGNLERKQILATGINITDYVSKILTGIYSEVITENSKIVNIKNEDFNLVHEPIYYNDTCFNLFGHIHNLQMVKRFGLNIGIDCHRFTPVSIETVLEYKHCIESVFDKNVFI